MMRFAIVLAVVLATATARAEVCSVAIPRAPDEFRAEIETWVRAEPRCSVELEVRVVPTDNGYYLFARDQHGRVRERIVPDAQSAGVLVASWVADDSVIQTIDEPPPSVQRLQPRMELSPPGQVPPIAPQSPSRRWVSLGGMVQIGDPGAAGVRGELDLVMRGSWTIGAELIGAGTSQSLFEANDIGYVHLRDVQFLATVMHTSTFGRWNVRIGGGLGVTHTSANGDLGGDLIAGDGWFPGGELSLSLGRELGANWAFAVGPTVTAYSQTLDAVRNGMSVPLERHETQLLAFGGLRHRL